MGKILDMKKRRGAQRLLHEAATNPESKAIKKALEQPGVAQKLERISHEQIDSCHRQAVESFKNRQIADFWDKAAAPSKRKTTISETEFLKIIGRGDKSSAANSAWILRRIRNAAAKGDSSLFPSFKQMGRERLYHLDSVKAWLAQHPLDPQT